MKQSSMVQVVDRALRILQLFTPDSPKLSLTQIAERSSLSVATAHRILKTLESREFVQRDPESGKYSVGVACLHLGSTFLDQLDIRSEAYPILRELRDATKETVHLGILYGKEIVYVEKVRGLLPIGLMSSSVGGKAPAYCTGMGKALLACLSETELERLYADSELPQRTPTTVTSLSQLKEQLRRFRNQGYVYDNGENEVGPKAVAVPIWDHTGKAVAAIGVAGPGERIDQLIKSGNLVPMVREAARAISARLGGRSDPNWPPAAAADSG